MDPADYIPLFLLLSFGLAVGLGFVFFTVVRALTRRAQRLEEAANLNLVHVFSPTTFPQRPTAWMAVRSATPEAVKLALGLGRSTPCSWVEGLAGGHEFFISPPVHGWVIVTGLGLPHPDDDIDACFLFLTTLSRKLGHIQFFHSDRILQHHAWARLDDGCVTRAFAWAGTSVWNQGAKTLPETELGLHCFDYGDDSATFNEIQKNVEGLPLLAARWSLDPAEVKLHTLRQANGIAGESARIY
jgi:hypothetical protein